FTFLSLKPLLTSSNIVKTLFLTNVFSLHVDEGSFFNVKTLFFKLALSTFKLSFSIFSSIFIFFFFFFFFFIFFFLSFFFFLCHLSVSRIKILYKHHLLYHALETQY